MTRRLTCHARYARVDQCLQGAALRLLLRGAEAEQFARIHDEPRRRQWLAGRVVARELLCETLGLTSDRDLQIISRNTRSLGMAPCVTLAGRPLDGTLSISHTPRGVLVALGAGGEQGLGVDLCADVSTAPGFLRLWFTPGEERWIESNRLRAATLWAIKEAVYKAVSNGAPWNPREIEVSPDHASGVSCRFQGQVVTPLTLRRQTVDGHVAVIACLANDAEICLTQPGRSPRETRRRSSLAAQIAGDRAGDSPDVEVFETTAAI